MHRLAAHFLHLCRKMELHALALHRLQQPAGNFFVGPGGNLWQHLHDIDRGTNSLKKHANSNPIMPPPMMVIFSGMRVRSKMRFESSTASDRKPGMGDSQAVIPSQAKCCGLRFAGLPPAPAPEPHCALPASRCR